MVYPNKTTLAADILRNYNNSILLTSTTAHGTPHITLCKQKHASYLQNVISETTALKCKTEKKNNGITSRDF